MTTEDELEFTTPDGFGFYMNTGKGPVLAYVDDESETEEYRVADGTVRIEGDAFADAKCLKKVFIPSSVREIEDGAFSTGDGWADVYKGIEKVVVSKDNPFFLLENDFFCEIKPDGKRRLIRYTGDADELKLPHDITEIAVRAFFNKKPGRIIVPAGGLDLIFPSDHGFFLQNLLDSFGKNGLLYDFADYDHFLMLDHYNKVRIRMLLERLKKPDGLTKEQQHRLFMHLFEHTKETAEALILEDAAMELKQMIEMGFITAENVDEYIEYFNRSDKKDLLIIAMNFKNENIEKDDFDFEI